MLKLIQPSDLVFENLEYRRDIILFNVLDRAIRPSAFLLASDGESYIIARNRADLACWVWTGSDITKAALNEIMDALHLHFGGRELIVTAKPDVVKIVENHFAPLGYLEPTHTGLIAYQLNRLLPTPAVGRLRAATLEDLDMTCDWFRSFHADCFDRPLFEDPRPAQEASIIAGYTHLLMAEDKPVCMVKVAQEADKPYCLVHTVYTPPQYRGLGYAKQAVSDAVRPYLHQGLYALLYADACNPRSNAAYQHIGFEAVGTVIETTMKLGTTSSI